jgi:hypothetical protein
LKENKFRDVISQMAKVVKTFSTLNWLLLQETVSNDFGEHIKHTFLSLIMKEIQYHQKILKPSTFPLNFSHSILFDSLETIGYLCSFENGISLQIFDICLCLYKEEQYQTLEELCYSHLRDFPLLSHYLGLIHINDGNAPKVKDCFNTSSTIIGINNISLIHLEKGENEESISKIFKSFNIKYKGLKFPLFQYFSGVRGLCERHPDLSLFYSKKAIEHTETIEDIVNQNNI